MWQLLFWISLAEILLIPTVIDMDKKDRAPGDFALDPLNFCKVQTIVSDQSAVIHVTHKRETVCSSFPTNPPPA